MNFILRFVALVMSLGLALSADVGTFSSSTKYASSVGTAVEHSNGYVVTITSAGWIYGDSFTVAAQGSASTIITPIALSGLTGVGILVTGGVTGCTTAPTVKTTGYTGKSLVGKATAGCPADFATLYSSAPSSSTTNDDLAYKPYFSLVVGTVIKYEINAPSANTATQCDGIHVVRIF